MGERAGVEYSFGVSCDEEPKGSEKQQVSEKADAFGNEESGIPAIIGGDEGIVFRTIGRMFVSAGQGVVGDEAEDLSHVLVSNVQRVRKQRDICGILKI